jgi:hypothetical protein
VTTPEGIGHVSFAEAPASTPIGQNRDGRGRWIRGVESIERDREALRMRGIGWSLPRISDELGYGGKGNVSTALKRAKDDVIRPATQELIDQEIANLDHLIDRAIEVLERNHVTVSHGRVITQIVQPAVRCEDAACPGDSTCHLCTPAVHAPVLDDGPTLQAVATLQRLYESRRKLLGTDAATKIDATVHEVTQEDLAINDLLSAAKARNALAAEAIRSER